MAIALLLGPYISPFFLFFCDLLLFEGKCQFQLGTLFIYVCIKKCTFFIVNLRFDWLMLWYFFLKKLAVNYLNFEKAIYMIILNSYTYRSDL